MSATAMTRHLPLAGAIALLWVPAMVAASYAWSHGECCRIVREVAAMSPLP